MTEWERLQQAMRSIMALLSGEGCGDQAGAVPDLATASEGTPDLPYADE